LNDRVDDRRWFFVGGRGFIIKDKKGIKKVKIKLKIIKVLKVFGGIIFILF